MVEGGGFEPPKLARQIYSLIPLATREPLQEGAYSLDVNGLCQLPERHFRPGSLAARSTTAMELARGIEPPTG
jgi:hypothetical protein